MSETRKINLFSSTGKAKQSGYESKATNYTELKKELEDLGIDLKNKSITDFTNQTELTKDTELPLGDLKLYILPAQVKSGDGRNY